MVSEYDEAQAISEAMKRVGGGFVKALGEALMRADPGNRARIKGAFPEYWEQYRKIARRNDFYLNKWEKP